MTYPKRVPIQGITRTYKTKYPKSNAITKWAEDMNIHFSKDTQMVGRHMKRSSTSLIIQEIQIKTTMGYDLTPVEMAKIKNSRNNKCCQVCGKKRKLSHCLWGFKLVSPLWKIVLRFFKNLKKKYPTIK